MASKRQWPTLRRVQTLSPFGMGAVVDISGESFAVAGQELWSKQEPHDIVHLKRLEEKLGRAYFRTAPAAPGLKDTSNKSRGLPVVRFPRWQFCPDCRGMVHLDQSDEHRLWPRFTTGTEPIDEPASKPVCPESACRCKGTVLVPMRFVAVCANGHLDDVDWVGWAHSEHPGPPCSNYRLSFEQSGVGGSLKALHITCRTCGARHSLGDISHRRPSRRDPMDPENGWRPFKDGSGQSGGCRGRQPWEQRTRERCTAVPLIVARGGSNVTFLALESAIDIPPASNYVFEDPLSIARRIQSHAIYVTLVQLIQDGADQSIPFVQRQLQLIVQTLRDPIITRDLVWQTASEEAGTATPTAAVTAVTVPGGEDILAGEFSAFLGDVPKYHPENKFQIEPVDRAQWRDTAAGRELGTLISHVVKVTVLREVRVQRGYSRLVSVSPPSADAAERVPRPRRARTAQPPYPFINYDGSEVVPKFVPAGPDGLGWLPAIEVFGEGVFFALDENAVATWRADEWISTRIANLAERQERVSNEPDEAKVTPDFVLLHTLAHQVCLQLAFTCGYSLASLRERIYSGSAADGTPMHGILIYTSASDTEGSLGGLARQGDASRFLDTLVGAITEARWCSCDPLCIGSTAQGRDGLNMAACHGCVLLPETSCVKFNLLLDRALLVGDLEGQNHQGFFKDFIDAITHVDGTQ